MGLSAEYDAWFVALRATLESSDAQAIGETVLREVFGAWEELPQVWRDVFTANGPALLAEMRGEERLSEDAHFDELSVPTLVVTANASPGPIQSASEALARALPGARAVRVGGDHAIDPGGPEIRSFVAEHAVA